MTHLPTRLCHDTPFGTYLNQVSMNPPDVLELSGPIGIDLCLATEIAGLWAQGIRTLSSCCGHTRIGSYIGVSPWDADAMVDLGYQRDQRNLDIFAFTSKTGCDSLGMCPNGREACLSSQCGPGNCLRDSGPEGVESEEDIEDANDPVLLDALRKGMEYDGPLRELSVDTSGDTEP